MVFHRHILHILVFLWLSFQFPRLTLAADEKYESINTLMKTLLASGTYNIDLRPVDSQTDSMTINVTFALMSIVSLDDVAQKFSINGFLTLAWYDDRLIWDPADYGGVTYISPQPKSIWRPRMMLLNTLADRDMFKDDFSPLFLNADGSVVWAPGGLLHGSCALNMAKYPFDEQQCYLRFCPMSHHNALLKFVPSTTTFDLTFFADNEGWDLTDTEINIVPITIDERNQEQLSCPNFAFKLKRRPGFFMFNIILPVLVLAFLNAVVYIIPTESGEKVGYGITVLLSISVFLTTVSGMVPKVSDNIPLVSIYLFVLFICCSLSMVFTLVICYLHHKGEDPNPVPNPLKKLFNFPRRTTPIHPKGNDKENETSSNGLNNTRRPSEIIMDTTTTNNNNNNDDGNNKYKVLSSHLNRIGFALSIFLYFVVNLAFLLYLYI